MGGIFDSGPSDGEIRRAEEKAYKKEQERLRLQEQKLRQRESSETMQGEGIATPDSISLGDDLATEATGLDQSVARTPQEVSTSGTAGMTELQRIQKEIADGTFKMGGGLSL